MNEKCWACGAELTRRYYQATNTNGKTIKICPNCHKIYLRLKEEREKGINQPTFWHTSNTEKINNLGKTEEEK